MASDWITWPKEMRAKAKIAGKTLIACGADGPGVGGTMVNAVQDGRIGAFLFWFAMHLNRTGDPFAAFREANDGLKVPYPAAIPDQPSPLDDWTPFRSVNPSL